jgi:hypothetical protein
MVTPQRQCFAYPLRVSASGGLELAKGDEVTQDRIRSIVETRPREMVMRANYGLSDQAFTAIPSPDVIAERVRQAVEIQMKGEIIPFISSQLDGAEGLLQLQIDWIKTGENSQQGGASGYGYGAQGGGVSLSSGRESISYSVAI